jgi:hypothetical protein
MVSCSFYILVDNLYKEISNLFPNMLHKRRANLNRRITWLSATTISSALFLIGFLLLLGVEEFAWLSINYPAVSTFLKEVGSIIMASGLVAIIWEISIKRTFFNEVMEKVGLATDVDKAGLIGVTMQFYNDIDWEELFKNVKKLDILFSYGGTWRHVNTVQLRELADRGVSIRVVLPDTKEENLMIQLGNRYGYDADEMGRKICEAKNDFKETFDGTSSDLKLYCTKIAPLFDVYRFDDVAIITMFKHRRTRVPVPVFQAKRGGDIYDFVDSELKAFFDGPNPIASLDQ